MRGVGVRPNEAKILPQRTKSIDFVNLSSGSNGGTGLK